MFDAASRQWTSPRCFNNPSEPNPISHISIWRQWPLSQVVNTLWGEHRPAGNPQENQHTTWYIPSQHAFFTHVTWYKTHQYPCLIDKVCVSYGIILFSYIFILINLHKKNSNTFFQHPQFSIINKGISMMCLERIIGLSRTSY